MSLNGKQIFWRLWAFISLFGAISACIVRILRQKEHISKLKSIQFDFLLYLAMDVSKIDEIVRFCDIWRKQFVLKQGGGINIAALGDRRL